MNRLSVAHRLARGTLPRPPRPAVEDCPHAFRARCPDCDAQIDIDVLIERLRTADALLSGAFQ